MNRRQFFRVTAASAALMASCEQRRVRLWLADVKASDAPNLIREQPTTYRDVAAERLVPSLKTGDEINADTVHRACDLAPGDALFKRRVRNGDRCDFPSQIWVVCRVEVLS